MGYQIPNFTYPGASAEIFPRVVAQAREAEAAGFDTLLLMDHFYQLPGIGQPDEPMLECYTALGALAGVTQKFSSPLSLPATRIATRRSWPRR